MQSVLNNYELKKTTVMVNLTYSPVLQQETVRLAWDFIIKSEEKLTVNDRNDD